MTEPSTTTPQPDVELTAEPGTAPFLRITGTYPAGDDRYETICLEMNLDVDEELAEVEPDVDGVAIRSWLTDFCTQTIGALRQAPAAQTIVLAGSGVTRFLNDRVRHASDCDGTCGQPADDDARDQQNRQHRQFVVDRAYGRVDPNGKPVPTAAAAADAQNDGGA